MQKEGGEMIVGAQLQQYYVGKNRISVIREDHKLQQIHIS